MAEKRGRWVLNIILVVAVLALVGFSMLPLLNATLQAGQKPTPSPATPSAVPAPVSAQARKSDLESLVRGYELVLQREPENLTALQGTLDARLALLQDFKTGEAKELIDPLEKLARLKPDQPNYMVLLAQTKEYLNDREGAAQAYRKALTQNPGNPYALTGFVNLYLTQEKPEAAIGFLKDTLASAAKENEAKPGVVNLATVQVLLAEVYTKLKRIPDAIATYDAAIASDASDFRPHLGKARVLLTQGKPQDAKLAFDQAFKLAPANYKDAIRKESAPIPLAAVTPESSAASFPTPSPASATSVPTSGTPNPSTTPASLPTPTSASTP